MPQEDQAGSGPDESAVSPLFQYWHEPIKDWRSCYDNLTVDALRLLLAKLATDQIRTLIAYERAHANRTDLIAMCEQRVAARV